MMETTRCITLVVLISSIIIFHGTSPSSCAKADRYLRNCSSSCGNIHNITFPFRLTTDPISCGISNYELSCKNNRTLTGYNFMPEDYYVQAINYNNYTIRLVPSNVQKDNCSSLPTYPGEILYFLDRDIPFCGHAEKVTHVDQISERVLFLRCKKPVLSPLCIDTAPCISQDHSYVVFADGFKFSDLNEFCQIYNAGVVSSQRKGENRKKISSYIDIHDELLFGFELSWVQAFQDYRSGGVCCVDEYSNEVLCPYRGTAVFRCLDYAYTYTLGVMLGPRTILGISFVIALIIYKWRRRHLSIYKGIEEFLQSHNNLIPVRYAYSGVRKMTKGFKTKLGEGGFGSVYKAKLRSGHFAAIKMLGKSKGSGQDFINEVATIGRIHHVNVVRLIGFCVEGSKRALVYDFMPNGSLDKYIFLEEGASSSLSFDKIFEISLGVARGIEYLHRGCDMQILHFDIKPHNILLDEHFTPKIADFGLARLCPLENSIVSLTAARGTTGYIAPELFYRNIGGVSHKADVYSFGMLLMEMASKRKNLNINADNTSEIYFPLWIYDQFSEDKDIEIEDATKEESDTVRKMVIVALWCIQLKPCDRPSMSKVIEMLEADVERLQMPPKPCLYPQENQAYVERGSETTETLSSTQFDKDSTEICAISNECAGESHNSAPII
ncbi:hypothetical protein TIFTF001_020857 [Ficus carica]|uniref:Protein kinase domain-containing protein n=1 Tax=Ficus carica TaxID=3494 RepID=A0AA88A9G0_FICCA|nr:hypothetical protein TIFTF001_020857 [Ficus carica]